MEKPEFAAPSLANAYAVFWYENGRLLVRGFKTQAEAMAVYDLIVDQHEATRPRWQRPIRVYLAWILAGYEDNER